jgi:hypothetical protein
VPRLDNTAIVPLMSITLEVYVMDGYKVAPVLFAVTAILSSAPANAGGLNSGSSSAAADHYQDESDGMAQDLPMSISGHTVSTVRVSKPTISHNYGACSAYDKARTQLGRSDDRTDAAIACGNRQG